MSNRIGISAIVYFGAGLSLYDMYARRKSSLAHAESTSQYLTYYPPSKRAFPFFNVAVHNNPHFEKRYKGGEDSFMISSNQRLIGVADGVGGWANKDICSGECAKKLCDWM